MRTTAEQRKPRVRHQTHGFDIVKRKDGSTVNVPRIAGRKAPFTIESTMRQAFMNVQVKDSNSKTLTRVLRSLRRRSTQPFNVQGWRVINRRGKRGKRNR